MSAVDTVIHLILTCFVYSREDLEDLLADPTYFQAIFHSLNEVTALYQSQAELGLANESIASESFLSSF